MEKRLPLLIEMRRKHLSQLRANQSDPAKDKNGSATNSLAGTLRFLGVADYVQNKSVEGFRSNLSEAAGLRKSLFERFAGGDAISPSYLSMRSYKSLFDALAAGDFQLAKDLASHMGGRSEFERENDHPFDLALGYVLRSFVLDEPSAVKQWLAEFRALCGQPDNADFEGYSRVFQAMVDRNADLANEGFAELLEGHRHQSKVGGVFKDTEDEMLCVWGLGLANLARMYGIAVQAQEPLIPAALLI